MDSPEIKDAEAAFTRRCFKPTPVKQRLKVSTLQLLRQQCRVNIISPAEYLAELRRRVF